MGIEGRGRYNLLYGFAGQMKRFTVIIFFAASLINAQALNSQAVLSLRNQFGFSGSGVIQLDNPFGFIPPANAEVTRGLIADMNPDGTVWQNANVIDSILNYNIDTLKWRQTNAAQKPTLITSYLNNHNVVHWTGGQRQMYNTDLAAVTNFTVFLVQYESDTLNGIGANYVMGSSINNSGVFPYSTVTADRMGEFDGTNPRGSATKTTKAWVIYCFTPTQIFKNGTEMTYQSTGNMSNMHLDGIGNRGNIILGIYDIGYTARILFHNVTLTSDEITSQFSYLNTIYNIY